MHWKDYRYFKRKEFTCHHCDDCYMKPEFIQKLDDIRHVYGKPIIITSGFRCADYNEEISTTGRNGPHTQGIAADISVSGADAIKLIRLATAIGLCGLGVKQHGPRSGRFLHFDLLEPRIWTYG